MDRNLGGQTFGRWHVIGYAGKNNGYKVWMCKCDCGTMREVRESHLLDGRSKSCGCLIHDKPSTLYSETRLSQIRQYDAIKNEYAARHNIPLVRIPYSEKEEITLDLLFSDKYLVSA